MSNVLVVGETGQLASCLKEISPDLQYVNRLQLDLARPEMIQRFFSQTKPEVILNLASYTNVEKAEEEKDLAKQVNALAVEELARNCQQFIHISTDYVYDGKATKPYFETDNTNPLSHYGFTKLLGEQLALSANPNTIIIRTSWLYSEYGVNFVKKMLEFSKTRSELKVVDDQRGTPTNAHDLAGVLKQILNERYDVKPGIYHYSNEGECSWFDFTKKIFEFNNIRTNLIPVTSKDFPTKAERPKYSVMDKSKIKNALRIQIPGWADSLQHFFRAAY